MAGVSEDQVLRALAAVIDPERQADLVGLGMISGLTVRDGHVLFSIEVDPKRGAAAEPLRQAAERAVKGLPGVLSVSAVLTAHRSMPAEAARPAARPHAGHAGHGGRKLEVEGVGAIIAVASGKGGVGKSTVAVNLALGLAALGRRVGLLDADIYGPSVPRLLGLTGKPASPDDKTIDPLTRYGIKAMSMGLLVDEETPMIWRGPMVQSALVQMLRDVNWAPLDVLVVDMPPGTGDAQLTLAQQVPLAGAVIVSTPQDIALLDARKGLAMFRKVDVPVLGLVENMSYFSCPHCGERTEIFGHGGARREAERLGCDFLGEVPLDAAIRETSDEGRPIVAAMPDSPHAAAFRAIAERVWAKLAGALPRPAPRIVVE